MRTLRTPLNHISQDLLEAEYRSVGERQSRAHSAAIDRLCLNLLTGAPSLKGVREEYSNALAIEEAICAAEHLAAMSPERRAQLNREFEA